MHYCCVWGWATCPLVSFFSSLLFALERGLKRCIWCNSSNFLKKWYFLCPLPLPSPQGHSLRRRLYPSKKTPAPGVDGFKLRSCPGTRWNSYVACSSLEEPCVRPTSDARKKPPSLNRCESERFVPPGEASDEAIPFRRESPRSILLIKRRRKAERIPGQR